MVWSFYDLLEYGSKVKCEVCGGCSLIQGEPETPYICRRCRQKPPVSAEKVSAKRGGRKSTLTDEEKAERRKQANKKYKETHREQANQYVRNRKAGDPVFRLKSQTRNAIYQSFARTGNVKTERCEAITGLSQDDLIAHLFATYAQTYGQPWDGVEAVHIDHIVPIATAKTKEDVLRLCHYTNLQLLKAKDNLLKGSKYAESEVGERTRPESPAD